MGRTDDTEGTLTDVLDTEEVLPSLETRRDGDVDVAAVDEEQVRAPLVSRRVQSFLEDLGRININTGNLGHGSRTDFEPLQPRHIGLGSVRDGGTTMSSRHALVSS